MGPTSPGGTVTNILPASEQVTGPTWVTLRGTVTNSTVAAPDDTSTAQTLTASAGSVDSYLVDYIANPGQYSGKTVTASVYLRVASGTQNLGLFIINYGSSGYSVPNSEVVTLNTSWQRFDLTATNQAGLTTAYFQIGGGGTLTAGESISVWGAQMVVGSSQDNYVETQNTTTVTGSAQTLAANGLNQLYSYDSFGNLQSSGNYSFIQGYTAANQISGWNYDAAGNLLTDGLGSNYVYDGEGKIKSGAGVTYIYTAEGQRAEKSGSPAVDTIYFGGHPIGRLISGAWTDEIYGAGGLLAEVPGTQTGAAVYCMTDHLGSLVGTLSSTGSVLSTQDVGPFGEVFAGGSSDPFVFTGKERDAESGNDFFGARYYSNNTGRWMTPDWAARAEAVPYSDFSDPQSLNLYSYVQNNPVSRADAEGHAMEQGNSNGWWDPSSFFDFVRASANGGRRQTGGAALLLSPLAQQQSGSGPGFLGRLGQRLNNFFHNNGLVTNAELDQVHGAFSSAYIVPGSVHEIEPNSYVTMGLDAAGIGATLSGHAYLAGGIAAGSSIYNPDPMNLGLNGMSLVPGIVGEAAMPLTVVNDVGGLAGGVITNNVMAPMLMSIPGNTMNDGYGHTIPTPEATCVASGMC
jgi:RHS repeat-associated protein